MSSFTFSGVSQNPFVPTFMRTWVEAASSAATIIGSVEADRLIGGANDDFMMGEGGNDALDGGANNDTLIGQAGADVFMFTGAWGADAIQDFQIGTDRMDLSAAGVTSFSQLSLFNASGSTLVSSSTQPGNQNYLLGIVPGSLSAANFGL